MKYDFDKYIDRRNTNSIKYDFAHERGRPEGLLPMWVADMDFPVVPEVLADINKVVSHGIFGYTDVKDDYYDAVTGWFKERFDYFVTRDQIVKTPGIVFALAAAIKAYTNPGDSVMIQTPVYYPFFNVIKENNRKLIENPLIYNDYKYSIDFNDFERKAQEFNVKLFLLCSPHNPVGRVWTHEELETLNEICMRYGIIIISDEIHCDFTYKGHKHTMFGCINENTVMCTSPSKTFNIAGLQVANIFIKNTELRKKLELEIHRSGYGQLNTIAHNACKSAYMHGSEWLEQIILYLEDNIMLVRNYLSEKLLNIKLVEPEGTYLLWMDFNKLGLSQIELDKLIVQKAKLWLNSGTIFGDNGRGFQRINIACPKSVLETALIKLEKALNT